jgi:hypothetical protein
MVVVWYVVGFQDDMFSLKLKKLEIETMFV